MGVGLKIKEYRNKAGLTQKDLAEQLHVTYQAVSRWENDDAEPSIDALKKMCNILNCSIEDIFEMEKKNLEEEKSEAVEKIIIQEAKPVLAVCEKCNKPIYESEDINRVNEVFHTHSGSGVSNAVRQSVLCGECNKKRIEHEKIIEEQNRKKYERSFKIRRINSFIWPSIIAVALIIFAISLFTNGYPSEGAEFLVFAVLAYCFAANLILNNTFISELWCDVASWGFVKLPGIIFEFSLDGIIFLIAMKILFFILGMILSILSFIFATLLAMALSFFVYPYALVKNIKCKE